MCQLEIVYPSDDDDDNDCSTSQDINEDDDLHLQEVFSDEQTVVVLKNGIKIRRRQNHKVIRYVRFNSKSDEENYFEKKSFFSCHGEMKLQICLDVIKHTSNTMKQENMKLTTSAKYMNIMLKN